MGWAGGRRAASSSSSARSGRACPGRGSASGASCFLSSRLLVPCSKLTFAPQPQKRSQYDPSPSSPSSSPTPLPARPHPSSSSTRPPARQRLARMRSRSRQAPIEPSRSGAEQELVVSDGPTGRGGGVRAQVDLSLQVDLFSPWTVSRERPNGCVARRDRESESVPSEGEASVCQAKGRGRSKRSGRARRRGRG